MLCPVQDFNPKLYDFLTTQLGAGVTMGRNGIMGDAWTITGV
jgi:hypothetical protein